MSSSPPSSEPGSTEESLPPAETSSCCGGKSTSPEPAASSATPSEESCCAPRRTRDWLLLGSAAIIIPFYLVHWLAPQWLGGVAWLETFAGTVFELLNRMWWGLLIGILAVGTLSRIPRELVIGVIGRPGTVTGLFRATAAGVLLDLCSHGILLVGMQLYRRGASLGQTMAFLIASPWNSISLTFILIALIGWKWTLTFIVLSFFVALVSGLVFDFLVRSRRLPPNPTKVDLPDNFRIGSAIRKQIRETDFRRVDYPGLLRTGLVESKMILRWILAGTVLAAILRASVSGEHFATWFGPTITGLLITLAATTVIEVCSEGSSPIAADLLQRGGAPGNAFTFLMAGVATDYTEIMGIRETTRSWRIALALPLVTVPQIILLGWLLNRFAAGSG